MINLVLAGNLPLEVCDLLRLRGPHCQLHLTRLGCQCTHAKSLISKIKLILLVQVAVGLVHRADIGEVLLHDLVHVLADEVVCVAVLSVATITQHLRHVIQSVISCQRRHRPLLLRLHIVVVVLQVVLQVQGHVYQQVVVLEVPAEARSLAHPKDIELLKVDEVKPESELPRVHQ